MSDGAYALVDALTVIALAVVLYLKWSAARSYKRLLKSIEEQGYRWTPQGFEKIDASDQPVDPLGATEGRSDDASKSPRVP